MPKPIFVITLFTFLLCGLISCSRHPEDQKIVEDIQQNLAADPDTKDANVDVASKEGKVTLKGKAKNPVARQKAEQIAQSEPGVSKVDDEIALEEAAMPAEPSQVSSPAPAHVPRPVEKPKPEPIVIPVGTVITARLDQALSSKTAKAGDTFSATLSQPIVVDGKTVVPSGSAISGTVIDAKSKGKIKGEARLDLAANGITIHGKQYPIQTETQSLTEKGKGKRTAATTGGGAAGGALIGGLAGGGKGAGIGALVGAGAGLAGGALTGNKQIELPVESQLSFQLTTALALTPGAAEETAHQ